MYHIGLIEHSQFEVKRHITLLLINIFLHSASDFLQAAKERAGVLHLEYHFLICAFCGSCN